MAYKYESPLSVNAQELIRGVCGSLMYAAPEVLGARKYSGFAADLWSCGVCFFALLFNFFPLVSATPSDWRYRLLQSAQFQNSSSVATILSWYTMSSRMVSKPAVEFIDGLLLIDYQRRPTARAAAKHAWLANGERMTDQYDSKGAVQSNEFNLLHKVSSL